MQGFRTLFVGICLLLGFFSQAEAQEKRSLAVLPYVNIGVSEENIVRISSAFAQELVSKYRYLVKEGDSIRQKLSSIPDGCPNDTTCVARITQLLQVEQLLFFSAIDSGSSIEVSLIHVFGEKLKTAKVSLQGISSADWKKEIRTGLSQFFGTPKLTQPKSNKKTLLFLAIGTVLLGSSVTGFLLLQPTLGRVPE